jgi:hypothetical protein
VRCTVNRLRPPSFRTSKKGGEARQAPTYDALKRIDFDNELMQGLGEEMVFIQTLAHEDKTSQGLLTAARA